MSKILGVFIDNKLTFSDHIFNCVKKANNVCNTFLSNLYDMDNTLINLFETYALPLLDYASVIYSPHCLMLIDSIESVQRHFTKRLRGLSNYYYADRLPITQLDSLELRRIHTELVMMYKLQHGLEDSYLCNLVTNNIIHYNRGHAYKLFKDRFRLDIRKFFFMCRVVEIWNSPDVNALTINKFIRKIKCCNLVKFIRGRTLK